MLQKINRRIKSILKNYKNDCHFSRHLAMVGIIGNTLGVFMPSIAQKCSEYRKEFVYQYLYQLLMGIVAKYEKISNTGVMDEKDPVWVCWWSGVESCPELVRQCIRSIEKAAGMHPVYLITKDNYMNYLEIPEYILHKVQCGDMCIANFSDYLRVSLLEKYGGLWLDATIYVPRMIPEDIFEKSLYTCKSFGAKGYLANGRWTSYCLGGWKNHIFFKLAKECFEIYWKHEKVSIDYLLVDYIFSIIYDNHKYIQECFDEIPISNMERNDLAAAMVRGEDASEFRNIITEETIFYKLSWRERYPLKTLDGNESIYSYYLKMKI